MPIKQLKTILGFDEMDDPKGEWNTLRDAARKIFSRKGFSDAQNEQRYQGWGRADEQKKSSARARVVTPCLLLLIAVAG